MRIFEQNSFSLTPDLHAALAAAGVPWTYESNFAADRWAGYGGNYNHVTTVTLTLSHLSPRLPAALAAELRRPGTVLED